MLVTTTDDIEHAKVRALRVDAADHVLEGSMRAQPTCTCRAADAAIGRTGGRFARPRLRQRRRGAVAGQCVRVASERARCEARAARRVLGPLLVGLGLGLS